MSEIFKHACIKPGCLNVYEDNDPDAYYCATCNEQRKVIAKEIDAKLASTVSKAPIKTDLQMYDEIQRNTGARFISSKNFGI